MAIVTGAAGGMGGGITRRFVREGAYVVCVDKVDPAERVAELGRAEGIVQDVRDLEAMGRSTRRWRCGRSARTRSARA